MYLFRAHEAAGFEVTVVPAEDDLTVQTDRFLEAIDGSTAVVAFSHVLFRTSYIMQAAEIARRAREAGATVILDTYQSAGIVPLDVTALDVDFAVGGCLKWLCGGPGNAFLYTRHELRKQLKPTFTGWVSHRNPIAFDTNPVEARDVRPDAMGMMNGTPSIPAYYAALAGLDIVHEVGVPRIRAKSVELTGRLLALADQYGFPSAAARDPERLAGTVAINVPDALQVARTLKAREFLVDYRPPVGVRLSPHFYNTRDEIDRVMAEMASIVEKKDYVGETAKSLVT
jgi:kynureninase